MRSNDASKDIEMYHESPKVVSGLSTDGRQ